ncbi:MAG: hypothetical protein KA801_07225 [Syntrophorhabdaceae bacterium]|nr:hypothetical protein [Syntrophorhabdaceae bacterium]
MILPRDLIEKLVPSGEPPDYFLDRNVKELANSIENELLRRSYLWCSALTNAGLDLMSEMPPRLISYSAGFIHIARENTDKHQRIPHIDGFSYGVDILIESGDFKPQVLLPLRIDDTLFPVTVNYGSIEETGWPTHPHTGTGTCWVENQASPARWKKGILTCRHTVKSIPLGGTVNLTPSLDYSHPIQGSLADISAQTIDAAIVRINETEWPTGLSPLPICNPVAPGQPLSFNGRSSVGTGSVLRVFQHPNYIGNLFGQRIFTDCYGKHGDSGALFIDPSIRKGIGIHIGSVHTGSGNREGLCQHLSQASLFFGFSTFL